MAILNLLLVKSGRLKRISIITAATIGFGYIFYKYFLKRFFFHMFLPFIFKFIQQNFRIIFQ